MKKLILAFLIAFTSTFAIGGEIEKTFYFSKPSVEQSGDYQLIHFTDCLLTGYSGQPSIPWYAVKLLLPPGEKAVSFSVEGTGKQVISGSYHLYPQQASRPISIGSSGKFQYDQDVYQSADVYPQTPHGVITTQYMNGYSIAIINISPLQYIPSSSSLSYFTEMTVKVKTAPDASSERALSLISDKAQIVARVSNFVQNPDMLAAYPARSSRNDDYEILIITPQAFEDEFEDLTALYFRRGMTSEVVTVEDIYSSMTGVDNQEKIRNYIIQAVQLHGIDYVILGGDVEHVPYRGFYCYVQSGNGYTSEDIPADLYYCALDGSWNDNGNNLWGEIGEDDLLPDVALGRLSFSNVLELQRMINKTTSYQDYPILGELTNPLLAGEHLWDNPETWGSDYLNLLIGYHDDNGYTTTGIPPEQNIDSLYEKHQYWNGSTIMSRINMGRSFVHHSGHANSSNVMHLSIPDITNANFSQVNGIVHNFTFVFSHGCICGAFDDADCIMEHMVKIDNFAAAVIANSRYGWFNEGQTEGPAAHLHREMLDALYEEQLGRLGAAFVECKIQTAPWVNAPGQHEEGALRWNFYDINILGDPALQLWTDEPFTPDASYNSPVQIDETILNVSVSNNGLPAEEMVCVLLKDGILHGLDTTNASGEAIINIDPPFSSTGTAELIVSGYNCLTTTFNVIVSPSGGPYLIYNDHELNDTIGGNASGTADYGESILITVELANAGTADAINVEATMNANDPYLEISDDYGDYGNISAGTLSAPPDEFAIEVGDSIPDQHVVEISLDITDDSKGNWQASFNLLLNAPVLEAGTMSIDDSALGNGNGFLDPGETATLSFGALNMGHSTALNAEASLSSASPWVTLNNSSYMLGDLEPGINNAAHFQVEVDEDTPLGAMLDFLFIITAGPYEASSENASTVGSMVEDWETGNFEKFNWQFSGDMPWVIDDEEVWEGLYASRSGNIGNNQTSELSLYLDVLADGDLTFYRKISSEAEWDFLRFYIDYDMLGEWSGELDWEMVSFPVSAGLHTFRWVYEKDAYSSNGDDCAWVDYIVFPPVDITTGIPAQLSNENISLSIWPNPASSHLNIEYQSVEKDNIHIALYDLLGHEVLLVQELSQTNPGRHHVKALLSGLEKGVYICRIKSSSTSISRKVLVH